MYGWIWRHLPGSLGVRLVLALLLAAAVVVLLFFVVFPVVDPLLPWNHVTVTQPGVPAVPN
jgi:hypothetical protein